jgi:hypothetical protein
MRVVLSVRPDENNHVSDEPAELRHVTHQWSSDRRQRITLARFAPIGDMSGLKNGRSQRSSKRGCLAAFWPPGNAQHCHLLRTSEQYSSRSPLESAGGRCT